VQAPLAYKQRLQQLFLRKESFDAFRQGLETGKWDASPGGFPTVDAAMKQPRPTPRALSIATSAAYESAIASLRGQNDTGPARSGMATFRADLDSLPADAPRRNVLHRLSTQLDAMIAQHEGNTGRAIALLQELAPTEPNNASLPPSTIPSYELLGPYLLAAGRKAEAADAYQKALELRPNRSLANAGWRRRASSGTSPDASRVGIDCRPGSALRVAHRRKLMSLERRWPEKRPRNVESSIGSGGLMPVGVVRPARLRRTRHRSRCRRPSRWALPR
jgi:hypothetical protein